MQKEKDNSTKAQKKQKTLGIYIHEKME